MKRYMRVAAFFAAVFLTMAGTTLYAQAASGEWKQDNVGIWYRYTDGSYAKSGWVQLDDKWYYFDDSGYVKTGWFLLGSNWYFADAAGVMQTGILEDGENTYLLADSGEMLTGWQRVGNVWRFFRMNNSEGYPTGSMMTENTYEQDVVKYGIDISKWQGDINWDQVKEYGIDFTIIRIGHGERTLDTKFDQNMKKVNELGIPAGVYFYSEAKDSAQAVQDAQWVIDNLNGYTVSYPVVVDMEDQSQSSVLTKDQITAIAGAFCDEIERAGYTPMIYCNENWAKNYLDLDACSNARRWIARYNYKYDPDYHPDIWQCSSKGRIGGIQGNVDIDFAFTDFTQIIVPRTAASESYVRTSILDSNIVYIDTANGTAQIRDLVAGTNKEVPLTVVVEGTVYRMYNPNSGEHFYTKSNAERDALVRTGWNYEENASFATIAADAEGAQPVYRVYNPNSGLHHYTMNHEEAILLQNAGWSYEGVSFYAYGKNQGVGSPQYRLYNPNNGQHHWTVDSNERDYLVRAGWNDEGIAWRVR